MDRLTKEQIENMRSYDPNHEGPLTTPGLRIWQSICDLALQSLSQESVRSAARPQTLDEMEKALVARKSWLEEGRNEGLEEAAKVCEKAGMWAIHGTNSLEQPITVNRLFEEAAAAIRALSPARVAEGIRLTDYVNAADISGAGAIYQNLLLGGPMGNREEVIERAEKHLRQLAPHQRDREAAKLIADLLGAIFAPALSQESVRSEEELEERIHKLTVDVSAIPKPHDPENFPEGVLVTIAELRFILHRHFGDLFKTKSPSSPPAKGAEGEDVHSTELRK